MSDLPEHVVCPHCGAANPRSSLVTLCCQCFGSLEGAPTAAAAGAPTATPNPQVSVRLAPTAVPPQAQPRPPHPVKPQPAPMPPSPELHRCPECGYEMDPFDRECPRCARLATLPEQAPLPVAAPEMRSSARTVVRVVFLLAMLPFLGKALWSGWQDRAAPGPTPEAVIADPNAYVGRQVKWGLTLDSAGRDFVSGQWAQSYRGYTFHWLGPSNDVFRTEIHVMARDVAKDSGDRPREGLKYLVRGTVGSAYNDTMPFVHGVSGRVYLTDCAILGTLHH